MSICRRFFPARCGDSGENGIVLFQCDREGESGADTPLHSISGYAELLKTDMVKEEDQIPFAGKIYDEAQRMVQLVEDIISLSHLDEGAEDMQREKVDLYELAGKAVRSLEPEAEEARVTLELSGSAAVLYGIPQLLYSIIYNLTDNAIKYNRKNGKVTVDIRGTVEGIVLSVRDTGIGIAPEHRERIFERFYRVDKSHSKEVGGTGLGLSIVKHAAKIHDAKIEVERVSIYLRTNVLKMLYKIKLVCYNQNCFYIRSTIRKQESVKRIRRGGFPHEL